MLTLVLKLKIFLELFNVFTYFFLSILLIGDNFERKCKKVAPKLLLTPCLESRVNNVKTFKILKKFYLKY
jgi:hypothetical protein